MTAVSVCVNVMTRELMLYIGHAGHRGGGAGGSDCSGGLGGGAGGANCGGGLAHACNDTS